MPTLPLTLMRNPLRFMIASMFFACGATPVPKPPSGVEVDAAVVEPTAELPAAVASALPEGMTRERLEAAVVRIATVTEGGGGVIAAVYDEVPMLVVSDQTMDRMRIVSPIVETAELDERELAIMMEANFHSTLDARYATSEGVLYSVFIHPLSGLDESELESAMRQVAALVRNFRSTWSSDEMIFGSGGTAPEASPVF